MLTKAPAGPGDLQAIEEEFVVPALDVDHLRQVAPELAEASARQALHARVVFVRLQDAGVVAARLLPLAPPEQVKDVRARNKKAVHEVQRDQGNARAIEDVRPGAGQPARCTAAAHFSS